MKPIHLLPLGLLLLPWAAFALLTSGDPGAFPVDPALATAGRAPSDAAPLGSRAVGRAHAAREVASPVDKRLFAANRTLLDRPDDPGANAAFALLLEEKAREVGNAAYHRMAEAAARKALAKDARHELARAALAVALCGQHRFAEALAFVRTLPGETQTVWRGSCEFDALFELGRNEEAVEAAQRLVDLKPGAESYPRVAQVRELFGDVAGSREMWRLAQETRKPESSAYAWAVSQGGDVELRQGDFEAARRAYRQALDAYPGYYLARLGLARCHVAAGELAAAEGLLVPLVEDHGDVPTAALLGDVEEALGRTADAGRVWDRAVAAESFSASAGVADRKALALFLADHEREPERAVELARAEVAERPTVLAEDALAWALLRAGHPDEARQHSERARRLGTRSATFAHHAGEIELALGRPAEGKALLEKALASGLRASVRQTRRVEQLLAASRP